MFFDEFVCFYERVCDCVGIVCVGVRESVHAFMCFYAPVCLCVRVFFFVVCVFMSACVCVCV